ncbi:hypothetical protein SAMN04488577_3846 [Bacillus sp. cl95]|nr:hypothetical protein SAMN02799634_10830 [Bacillus sp. UNCCL13]SFQ90738.1 hypothetical protein SAMN04488577_3846 [Bacillus sp. cl95]
MILQLLKLMNYSPLFGPFSKIKAPWKEED